MSTEMSMPNWIKRPTKKVLTKGNVKTMTRDEGIELVRVECEDINGVSRGFTLDVHYFVKRVGEGFPIPKGIFSFKANKREILPNTGVQEEIGYANGVIYPDFSTFRVLPWQMGIASVLSDFRVDNGNEESPLFTVSPRSICKLQLEKLKELGIKLCGSFDLAFYLLTERDYAQITDDENGFSTHSQIKFLPFIREVISGLKGMDIRPEAHHSECGPGQQKITCNPEFGIQSPDNAFRLKHIVKEIASGKKLDGFDVVATFMTQPLQNEASSSGHYNHSLWDENDQCLMFDSDRKHGFSETAENWLAGLLYHSNALMCLAAPFPNCYERIIPECNFAPSNNSWGFDNRTVAYRIKNKQSPKVYIENRMAGAAVNPYLLVAGTIIAGMDGIKRKLELNVEPFSGDISQSTDLPENIKPLPTTLQDSLECLTNNEVFVKELGPEFMKCFTATRNAECQAAQERRRVTNDAYFFKWYRETYAKFI